MKALKKNGLGGGLVAALLVMAVLGLFSLTGCSNTSGNTATLNYSGVSMTITLRADGKIIWGGTSYTKQ